MPQLCSGLVLLVAVPGRVAIAGAMLVVVMMPAMAWCQLSGQAPALLGCHWLARLLEVARVRGQAGS